MEKTRDVAKLNRIARQLRRDIVTMLFHAGSGHPGGSLGSVELVTALYWGEMNHRPENPHWADRDRFVLSKGHVCPVLYAALAGSGYFARDILRTLRKLGSPLQGHPCMLKTRGVEISSGSLGQGLSVGNGMALAGRLDGKDYRVYVLLGDGECQEGQVWEAALTSAHYKIDNLCAILDYNNLQIDGKVSDVKELSPLREKWSAFGWHALEIDGHDFGKIFAALDEARATKGKPTMIVARTLKGKGVAFMEGQCEWHGKSPKQEELDKALAEIG